ncbi:siderophore ABC transporter substrate-binding protein [Bacillaceae bacterium W0354]
MKKLFFSILIVSLLVLAACGGNDDDTSGSEDKETITIEHSLDKITVEKNPERVVVFDFGTLDTLDALGIPVVGVPQMNVPSYLSKYESDEYENVGGLKEPDFEKIHALNPDLIIISGRQMDLYEDFKEIAPTLFIQLDTDNYMESFKENANLIGEIFGKKDEVTAQLSEIDDMISELQGKTSQLDQKALIVLSNGGKVSAYGPGSRFGIIHDVFGIEAVDPNIEVATHGQNISFEFIVDKDPDHLYVIDRDKVVNGEAAAKETIENDLVKNTTAYQEGQIHYLDPDFWYLSGGGLISVKEMVNEINQTID